MEAELGAVRSVVPVGSGLWRIELAGRPGSFAVKVGEGVDDEASGLRVLVEALADTADPSRGAERVEHPGWGADDLGVPPVLLSSPGMLVAGWAPEGTRTPAAEEALGRGLARLHAVPGTGWGGGSSWIGDCPVDPGPADSASAFYGRRLTELAHRAGASLALLVESLVDSGRMATLLEPVADRSSVVHGDLWWGNVVWAAGNRPWLIDPSVHAGCGEEDLAMLGLFGPVPGRTMAAYREVRSLADGWEDRQALFRLVPLLVHTVLFGGGYGARASAILVDLTRR